MSARSSRPGCPGPPTGGEWIPKTGPPVKQLRRARMGRSSRSEQPRGRPVTGVTRHGMPWKDGAVMKRPKDLGMTVLAVWLIVFGLLSISFLKISFAHSGDVQAVLAIAAGVSLFLKR